MVVHPFLGIVNWTAILAIDLHPVVLVLKRRLGQRCTVDATLITLLGIAFTMGPLALLGVVVFDNVEKIASAISWGQFVIPSPAEGLESWPLIGNQVASLWRRSIGDLGSILQQLKPQLENLTKFVIELSANAGITRIHLIISMVVAAGFMVNPRALRLRIGRVVSKLAPAQIEDILILTTSTIQNVIRGAVGVSVVQTGLVGVGLFAGRIPGAGLLVVMSFVLTIIQLGPTLIARPAIIDAWITMTPLAPCCGPSGCSPQAQAITCSGRSGWARSAGADADHRPGFDRRNDIQWDSGTLPWTCRAGAG